MGEGGVASGQRLAFHANFVLKGCGLTHRVGDRSNRVPLIGKTHLAAPLVSDPLQVPAEAFLIVAQVQASPQAVLDAVRIYVGPVIASVRIHELVAIAVHDELDAVKAWDHEILVDVNPLLNGVHQVGVAIRLLEDKSGA